MPQDADKPKADRLENTVILSDRLAQKRAANLDGPCSNPGQTILIPGDHVGPHAIQEIIGGGGMGSLYKAHDTAVGRTVALKVLPPHLCENELFMHRFRSEARLQARFNSPYIATLYSLMDVAAGRILVMEYLEGETLEQRIRREGPLPAPEAAGIFEQVLLGVEFLHEHDITHRDLKPGNIFFTNDNQMKLLDFGVAEYLNHDHDTLAKTMMGTLLYISPEQINGGKIDRRSDIYTLGVTLFEIVTGRLPFEKKTDYGLMHAHVQEAPPKPSAVHRRVAKKLDRIILKAINKDPAKRYQTANDFRQALIAAWPKARRLYIKSASASGNMRSAPGEAPSTRQGGPQPSKPSTLFEKLHAFSGLVFDLLLIIAAVVLVIYLGIFPRNA